MAHIFISYSKKNLDFARHLRDLLQRANFDVWMDEDDISTSRQWSDTLEAAITGCSAFVIVVSPDSKASDWVERELLLAERLRKPIFPILLAGDIWWNLANIQYEDMRAGGRATLSPRLITALRAAAAGAPHTDDTPQTVGSSHMPPPAPLIPQTDSRRLEAAMPAETKSAAETEIWAKIVLPDSEGLRGELPAVVPSGDVIAKEDARSTTFPIRFPVDPATGQRIAAPVTLRVSSGYFAVVSAAEVTVDLPPDADSRTVIFTLEPKTSDGRTGRVRVFIDLLYESKVIAQISVSTQLVAQVTVANPAWALGSQMLAASPATGGFGGFGGVAPAASSPAPRPEGIGEVTRGSGGSYELEDYLPQPQPQPSALPRPAVVTVGRASAPDAKRSARHATRSAPLLRIASGVAAVSLVFVVALFALNQQAPSPDVVTGTAFSTSIALVVTDAHATPPPMILTGEFPEQIDDPTADAATDAALTSAFTGAWIPRDESDSRVLRQLMITSEGEGMLTFTYTAACPLQGGRCASTPQTFSITGIPAADRQLVAQVDKTTIYVERSGSNLNLLIRTGDTSTRLTLRRAGLRDNVSSFATVDAPLLQPNTP